MSKRGRVLYLDSLSRGDHDQEFDHVCMDSTGIQTYTGNEWLENKHGKQYIRRTWKKLHIVVGDNGIILANSTKDHNKDDRSQIASLIKNIKTKEFLGYPGYDGQNIFQLLRSRGITSIIRPPSRKTVKASISKHL